MSQTFKRIALVAVAALSLGGLTSVSSNAVPYSDTLADTAAAATTSTSIGTAVYDTFTASFFAADTITDYETLTLTRTVSSAVTDAGVYSLTTSTSDSVTVVDSNTVKVKANTGLQITARLQVRLRLPLHLHRLEPIHSSSHQHWLAQQRLQQR